MVHILAQKSRSCPSGLNNCPICQCWWINLGLVSFRESAFLWLLAISVSFYVGLLRYLVFFWGISYIFEISFLCQLRTGLSLTTHSDHTNPNVTYKTFFPTISICATNNRVCYNFHHMPISSCESYSLMQKTGLVHRIILQLA